MPLFGWIRERPSGDLSPETRFLILVPGVPTSHVGKEPRTTTQSGRPAIAGMRRYDSLLPDFANRPLGARIFRAVCFRFFRS